MRNSSKKILLLFGIILLAWYVSTYWYQLMLIQGRSMVPAYNHMQIVVLDKHNRNYEKGDVIAFYCEGLSCVLVKRVAACPGDTAVIENGTLYVNGSISTVYPNDELFQYAGMLSQETILGHDDYLVLGDNVSESKDSRYHEVGLISKGDIIGEIMEG